MSKEFVTGLNNENGQKEKQISNWSNNDDYCV